MDATVDEAVPRPPSAHCPISLCLSAGMDGARGEDNAGCQRLITAVVYWQKQASTYQADSAHMFLYIFASVCHTINVKSASN